jgi:glycosyltransferase involved in cell wall biosynthesis
MITYNHESFITEAIEGVLMQNCEFDIEFIIANDKSTDQTDRIIGTYLSKVVIPNNIHVKYTNHKENKGVSKNFIWSLRQASGKYIAYCEGDDYWTDSLKLQKQVDFLEKNEEYEMSFTNIKVINENNELKKEKLIKDTLKSTYNHSDMPIWAPMLTRVFRNRNFDVINKKVPGMDTFMLVYQSTFGKIKYLNEITGAYRHHDGGVFSLLSKGKRHKHNIKTRLACFQIAEKKFKRKYLGVILKELIDLKKSDLKLFRNTVETITQEIGELKKAPLNKYLIFMFYFYLIKLPHLYKLSFFRNSINKALIY